jgi:hypothetical protein
MVGIYFRLPSEEPVWAGRYNVPHRQMPLGQAIREMTGLADPLGYEMFIERKIEASEITRVRHLPQKIGWRYQPHAHGQRPCPCPICLPKGAVKSRRIRDKYDPPPVEVPYETLKATLSRSVDRAALLDCLWPLRNKRRRKADPEFLRRLMAIDDAEIQEELARTLGHFSHPSSKSMLLSLCGHDSAEVREAAAESLVQLYRQDAAALLADRRSDPVISNVLDDSRGTFAASA